MSSVSTLQPRKSILKKAGQPSRLVHGAKPSLRFLGSIVVIAEDGTVESLPLMADVDQEELEKLQQQHSNAKVTTSQLQAVRQQLLSQFRSQTETESPPVCQGKLESPPVLESEAPAPATGLGFSPPSSKAQLSEMIKPSQEVKEIPSETQDHFELSQSFPFNTVPFSFSIFRLNPTEKRELWVKCSLFVVPPRFVYLYDIVKAQRLWGVFEILAVHDQRAIASKPNQELSFRMLCCNTDNISSKRTVGLLVFKADSTEQRVNILSCFESLLLFCPLTAYNIQELQVYQQSFNLSSLLAESDETYFNEELSIGIKNSASSGAARRGEGTGKKAGTIKRAVPSSYSTIKSRAKNLLAPAIEEDLELDSLPPTAGPSEKEETATEEEPVKISMEIGIDLDDGNEEDDDQGSKERRNQSSEEELEFIDTDHIDQPFVLDHQDIHITLTSRASLVSLHEETLLKQLENAKKNSDQTNLPLSKEQLVPSPDFTFSIPKSKPLPAIPRIPKNAFQASVADDNDDHHQAKTMEEISSIREIRDQIPITRMQRSNTCPHPRGAPRQVQPPVPPPRSQLPAVVNPRKQPTPDHSPIVSPSPIIPSASVPIPASRLGVSKSPPPPPPPRSRLSPPNAPEKPTEFRQSSQETVSRNTSISPPPPPRGRLLTGAPSSNDDSQEIAISSKLTARAFSPPLLRRSNRLSLAYIPTMKIKKIQAVPSISVPQSTAEPPGPILNGRSNGVFAELKQRIAVKPSIGTPLLSSTPPSSGAVEKVSIGPKVPVSLLNASKVATLKGVGSGQDEKLSKFQRFEQQLIESRRKNAYEQETLRRPRLNTPFVPKALSSVEDSADLASPHPPPPRKISDQERGLEGLLSPRSRRPLPPLPPRNQLPNPSNL